MTRSRKLSTTLMLLTATALVDMAVASAPVLAAPVGIPGPNPDAPGQVKKTNGPTINTTDGPVRGFVENGVNKFLGIPYAAPPTGNLRWMPPASPAKHGLLDATEFANTCPQVTELGAFAGPSSTTEDCLYLNVFTTGTSPANRSWSGFTAAEMSTVKAAITTEASLLPVGRSAPPQWSFP